MHRPDYDAHVNVVGTVRVLAAAQTAGAQVLFASTGGAIYGECPEPAREDGVVEPLSPYGIAKLCAEQYLAGWNRIHGTSHVALRFANVYGPRQDSSLEGGVVSIFLERMARSEEAIVFGDGAQTRDFVYVGDLAAAVVAVLDAPADIVAGEIFQAGTGRETTVNELAEAIGRAAGRPLEIRHGPDRAGDIRRNVSRVDKAAAGLGYRAAVSLEDGLARTARWYESALADRELASIVPHAVSGSD
jgi:UDP-glucose 4-epimerase